MASAAQTNRKYLIWFLIGVLIMLLPWILLD